MMSVLAFIRPCNPTTARAVPAGDAWLHEPKLDGYRIQIAKEGRAVRLFSGEAMSGPGACRPWLRF
jgi:ATP-dependent DNA ligase